MADQYSLSDSYVAVGGFSVTDSVSNFARNWVGAHYLFSFVLIIVLILIILWLVLYKGKEGFMPTATLRYQKLDGLGEHMDVPAGPTRAQSAFAQQTQDASGIVTSGAAGTGPGSLNYQILNSADYACGTRTKSTGDAWGWMASVAQENATGGPKNDSDFSKIMAGH